MKHSFGHHFSLRTRVILPSVNRYTGFLLFHSICRSFQKPILRERKMEHHRELRQRIGHNCRKCSVFFPSSMFQLMLFCLDFHKLMLTSALLPIAITYFPLSMVGIAQCCISNERRLILKLHIADTFFCLFEQFQMKLKTEMRTSYT